MNTLNDELLKRLDALAAKMNVTGTYLWQALLRQARVEAIQDIVFSIVFLLITIGCIYTILRCVRTKSADAEVWCPICTALGLISITCFLACASGIPTALFNPEYFALDKVIHALK